MTEAEKQIPLSEAAREVELVSRRLGLLHLAFARTIVGDLGEKAGRELILHCIKYYGRLVGEKAKEDVKEQGLPVIPANFSAGQARSLPHIGMHERHAAVEVDGQKRSQVYGCAMAKVWREYGEEELGSLYCFVDLAKYMYYNPEYKCVHTRSMPVSGGNCCEFASLPTSEKERNDFFTSGKDWTYIDGKIAKRGE